MASWTSDDVPSSGSATGLVADAIDEVNLVGQYLAAKYAIAWAGL